VKSFIATGKRKRATAKAVITAGNGIVTINNIGLSAIQPKIARMKLEEPLILSGEHASKVNISVDVHGGGFSCGADAARLAIAKALVGFTKDKKLEKTFLDYDRHLLVADIRRKEVRKPFRHGKARAKVQKSYR
jgi:small subunit ribosomal protein S9